jgi:very-short-patch-repair endonuclease
MSQTDQELAAIAARQRGLITLADAAPLGLDRRHLWDRTTSQRLLHVERGVYAVDGLPPDSDRALLATILATRGLVALSHLSAARRLGLPGYTRAPAELSIERGVRLRRDGLRIHESTDLRRCKILSVDGMPVTDPGRTLLDLARFVGDRRLARDMESARRLGLVDWADLVRVLATHARRGRPGVRRFRRVLAASCHRQEITDSDFELLVLALLLEHGLPEPVLHHRIDVDGRFIAEVDLAYPELRIAIECDGDVHLLKDVHERDLPRQNDLVLNGWCILRFTPDRYWKRPQSIIAEVRAAVATQQRLLLAS